MRLRAFLIPVLASICQKMLDQVKSMLRLLDFSSRLEARHNDKNFLRREYRYAPPEYCTGKVVHQHIWYSQNMGILDSLVGAPKMFREVCHLYLENTRLPNAAECS